MTTFSAQFPPNLSLSTKEKKIQNGFPHFRAYTFLKIQPFFSLALKTAFAWEFARAVLSNSILQFWEIYTQREMYEKIVSLAKRPDSTSALHTHCLYSNLHPIMKKHMIGNWVRLYSVCSTYLLIVVRTIDPIG